IAIRSNRRTSMGRMMTALALGLAAAGACAQPAVLEDGVLNIENGVVVEEEGALFYRNIQLEAEGEHGFRVVSAEPRNLAAVESVNVLFLRSNPVQVRVRVEGYISLQCLDLEEPVVSRSGNRFTVYLTETPIPPNVRCATVIEDFSILIPLETSTLEGGDYVVSVNGVEAEFTLAQ